MNLESRASSSGPVAAAAMTASAVGALVSMFTIGHRQRSVLLIVMFLGWVLSPYVALGVLTVRARRWTPSARATVRFAALLISFAALVRYAWVVVWPLTARPASTFLIVPLVSWVAIGVATVVAVRSSRDT